MRLTASNKWIKKYAATISEERKVDLEKALKQSEYEKWIKEREKDKIKEKKIWINSTDESINFKKRGYWFGKHVKYIQFVKYSIDTYWKKY